MSEAELLSLMVCNSEWDLTQEMELFPGQKFTDARDFIARGSRLRM